MDARIEALAAHLNITPDTEEGETLEDLIEESSYTSNEYEAEGNTYLVLTDEEADEAVAQYVRETLWAFNASFLADNTGLPEEVFTAMQDRCEGANETFLKLVEDCGNMDELVSDAISIDGRGHFLAQYDGEEHEEHGYYIFRT